MFIYNVNVEYDLMDDLSKSYTIEQMLIIVFTLWFIYCIQLVTESGNYD